MKKIMFNEQYRRTVWLAAFLKDRKYLLARECVEVEFQYKEVKGEWLRGTVIGFGRCGNEVTLKVKDRKGYIGYIPAKSARRVYWCEGACGREVFHFGARCPECQARFDSLCDSYRAMRSSAKDAEDLKNRINEFRGGKLIW